MTEIPNFTSESVYRTGIVRFRFRFRQRFSVEISFSDILVHFGAMFVQSGDFVLTWVIQHGESKLEVKFGCSLTVHEQHTCIV